MTTQFKDVPAWPEPKAKAETPPPAPRDHNKPPPEEIIPLEFNEKLLEENPDFLMVLDNLIGAADRAQATNDEELGKCGNLVNSYRKAIAHIDATHKAVKEPYLIGGRLVDAEKNKLAERVNAAKAKVERIGNAYAADKKAREDAERLRIEQEQRAAAEEAMRAERAAREAELAAERALAEAANEQEREAAQARAAEAQAQAEQAMADAALAAAAPTKAEPVRSDEGATVSSKQEWKSEVENYQLAFIHVEDHPKVREAIDKAVAQLVKAGKRQLDGVRIWPVAKANFR